MFWKSDRERSGLRSGSVFTKAKSASPWSVAFFNNATARSASARAWPVGRQPFVQPGRRWSLPSKGSMQRYRDRSPRVRIPALRPRTQTLGGCSEFLGLEPDLAK